MPKLSIECKKIMVDEISSQLNSKESFIITNYKGLTAQDLNGLRKSLRDASGDYLVVKDSMAKKALTDGPNNRIIDFIKGEVGIVIDNKKDLTYLSKILVRFAKEHEVLKIHGGMIKGEILSKEDIVALASLPSREILLGKLANVLNAPIQGLAGALSGIISKLLYALNALKDKKTSEDKTQSQEAKAQDVESKEKTEEKKESPKEPETKEEEKKEEEKKEEGPEPQKNGENKS